MFAPLLVYQVAVIKNDPRSNQKWTVSVGKEPRQLFNSLIVPSFFLILIVVLSLRHELVGKDLLNYKTYFSYYSSVSLKVVLKEKQDILYWLLNWVIGQFTDSYQVFLAVIACITVLPIAKLYSEDRQYGYLKIVLFMNMSVFIMLFSGLRQSVAMAFGLIAYEFVRKKKPFRFLLFALIALGFHHTGFMILLYYPLYHMKLHKNQLWFVIPVIGSVFVFNKQIFGWVSELLFTLMGDKYDVEIEDTGAYLMVILFALFAIVAYFFPDENKMDEESFGLRNFLLMAVLLQCFAPVHNLAMRMNYYFIIFIPIVMPKIFKHTKDSIKDVAKIAKGVIVGFFVVYYLYTTFISCLTGESALDTYPYIPFWEF
jgi:hypothetical protein